MPRYVDAEPIEQFITDGLNNKEKSYGWAGVEILTEVHYAPTADVAPVIHSHWIHTGEYLTNSDGKRLRKLSDLYVCHRCHRVEEAPEPYCNCGAKMDEETSEDESEGV